MSKIKNKQYHSSQKNYLDIIITNIANLNHLNLQKEYQGIAGRKYRFDWAFPDIKVAIEYEGLNFKNYQRGVKIQNFKSGHLTLTGYTMNCDKYNLAAIEGWIVLRYTAMNYHYIYSVLNKLLANKIGKIKTDLEVAYD